MSYQETKGMQCISRITFIFVHTLYMQLLKNCSCETYKTTDHILNEALPQRNAISVVYPSKTHFLPGFLNTAFTVTVAYTEILHCFCMYSSTFQRGSASFKIQQL